MDEGLREAFSAVSATGIAFDPVSEPHRASATAKEKIEKAGGSIELVATAAPKKQTAPSA